MSMNKMQLWGKSNLWVSISTQVMIAQVNFCTNEKKLFLYFKTSKIDVCIRKNNDTFSLKSTQNKSLFQQENFDLCFLTILYDQTLIRDFPILGKYQPLMKFDNFFQGCSRRGDLESWDFSKFWDFGLNKGYLIIIGQFFTLFKVFKAISLIYQ